MSPTILSTYLRIVLVYVVGAAAAAGAAYEVFHTGNVTSPIVAFAAAWDGALLGVHINNIGSPDVSVTTDPAPPVVLTDQPVTPPAPPA